jgi:hypothetical protein
MPSPVLADPSRKPRAGLLRVAMDPAAALLRQIGERDNEVRTAKGMAPRGRRLPEGGRA